MVSPDGHYSTQCATNSIFAKTSLNAEGRQSDSWDNRARRRLMIPGHKRVRCEASGRAQQSSGRTICHRTTPGNPTDITATYFRSFAIVCLETQLPSRRKGDAWFWGCQNYPMCTAPTTTTPPVPQNLKTLLTEAANPSSQRQDPSEGMSPPPGQVLGTWHGKGKYVSAVWGHHQQQGRGHWHQQVDPKEIGDRREEASLQPDGGGTHRTGRGAGRGRRSQEIDGGSPFGSPSSPEQSDRSSIPSGTGDGRNVPDLETVGGEPGASKPMKTSQKKRLLGGIRKTKIMRERWYESTKEEEKHSTIHRFL